MKSVFILSTILLCIASYASSNKALNNKELISIAKNKLNVSDSPLDISVQRVTYYNKNYNDFSVLITSKLNKDLSAELYQSLEKFAQDHQVEVQNIQCIWHNNSPESYCYTVGEHSQDIPQNAEDIISSNISAYAFADAGLGKSGAYINKINCLQGESCTLTYEARYIPLR